jgi:predicted Zn-dependent protease/predicted negative regulator of RcsB-dependent stress response
MLRNHTKFLCSAFGFLLLCAALPALAAEMSDADAAKIMLHADEQHKAGKTDEAVKELEALLKDSTLSPKLESIGRTTLASMYSSQHRAEDALAMVRKAHELNPTDERITDFLKQLEEFCAKAGQIGHFNAAVGYYNAQKFDDAVAELKELEKTPHEKTPKEEALMGMCLVGAAKVDEAMPHFEAALELQPNFPMALEGMGAAYEAKGDLKNAKLYFKRFASVTDSKEAQQAIKDRLPKLAKVLKAAGSAEDDNYFHAVSTPYITRWSLSRMPLRVFIEPTSQVANFNPEFEDSIKRAMNLWCDASEGKLKWNPVPDESTADIIVRFTADPNEVGMSKSHIEAGVCEMNAARQSGARIGGLTRANVKLLTTHLSGGAVTPQEMQDTAAHEIGHALGMREHSSNPEDTMYFAATRSTKNGLTQRDINTIRAVYGAQVYDDGTIVLNGKKIR